MQRYKIILEYIGKRGNFVTLPPNLHISILEIWRFGDLANFRVCYCYLLLHFYVT